MMVYKDSLGNVDLGMGTLTVTGIEAQKITAQDIEATNSLTAKVLGIDNESSGKGKIEVGETEVKIETPEASEDAKIYITPQGETFDKILFYDDIEEGKSFKVKIKKPADEGDIHFNWLIIK